MKESSKFSFCLSSCSSLLMLLLIVVPLILISGIVSVLGFRASWSSISYSTAWSWSNTIPSSSSTTNSTKGSERHHVGFHAKMVDVYHKEEALSHVVTLHNHQSSSPPLVAVNETLKIHPTVRVYTCSIFPFHFPQL
ncbi:hypothetical protein AQUCO_01900101v1 [Aquilegia coerulea]|uniref:Uncharacterized protein n=1 Tax=Aquilegia coerulea TaxID=218851 RepID=A0A2G5DIX0_AQUCA|nr:hypothetical protein AQUCO_01900101v1 [Aquilegia coerulea]